ncbi:MULTISPECIES: hypothetical protein [Burkholderia]|uniref:hypothetical protein n=1 Tax=Burkholderia TaxID=32008 RepID=UPI00128B319C|nr:MULTISPECIES: hypothetical protein [Burkholderia]MBR8458394.1 hypothetical protein [Burkholderia dolosa]MPV70205.1 hypothetical protein [Burkholderia sp. BE17]
MKATDVGIRVLATLDARAMRQARDLAGQRAVMAGFATRRAALLMEIGEFEARRTACSMPGSYRPGEWARQCGRLAAIGHEILLREMELTELDERRAQAEDAYRQALAVASHLERRKRKHADRLRQLRRLANAVRERRDESDILDERVNGTSTLY